MSAEENSAASPPKAIAPRASASTKTAARDYHDLFGAPDSDIHGSTANPTKPSANKENISTKPSPSKSNAGPPTRDLKDLFGDGHDADSSPHEGAHAASPEKNILSPGGGAPKVGASKHYKPIRLFETEGEESNEAGSLSKSIYKPDPKRFQHFEFGHGDEVSVDQTPRPKTKHQTQWDFEDFQTPVRPTNRKSNHPNRSFSLENDDPVTEKPPRVPAAAKGRPDANPHFEFQDDGAVAGERPYGQPRGAGSVRMTGLYQDHVFDGDRPPSPDKSKPLAPVTNLQDRRKDFDAHFAMTDSPSGNGFPADSEKAVPEARKKVVNAMAAHWSASDESPGSGMNGNTSNSGNKENINTVGAPTHVGIKSGGDGMGGKKGTSRQWGFGDESDGEHPVFRPERKSHVPKDNNIWDF